MGSRKTALHNNLGTLSIKPCTEETRLNRFHLTDSPTMFRRYKRGTGFIFFSYTSEVWAFCLDSDEERSLVKQRREILSCVKGFGDGFFKK